VYVVIAGAGTVGVPLCSALINTGHEVVVIENDRTRGRILERKIGSIVVAGDCTKLPVLEHAGVQRAGVFIAVTGEDGANLAGCQMAKHIFQVPQTVALVNRPDNAELFESLDIDLVVNITDLIMTRMAGALPAHPLLRLMSLTERSNEIVGIKVPAGAAVIGRPLKEISIPYGSVISIIINQNGHINLPEPDTVFESEDEVIAVTPTDATKALWEILTELK